MIRERNQRQKLAFIGLDLILAGFSFALAVILHFIILSPDKTVSPDFEGGFFAPVFGQSRMGTIAGAYLYPGLLITFLQVMVFVSVELYHPRRGHSFAREFMVIVRGVAVNLIVVLALLFFYREVSYSRLVILYTAIFAVILHSIGHYWFRQYLHHLTSIGYNIKDVLIMGTGLAASRLVDTLSRHSIYGYRVVGMVGTKKEARTDLQPLIKGSPKQWKSIVRKMQPDVLLYAEGHEGNRIREVVEYCDTEGIDCRIIPDYVDFITHSARVEVLDGLPVLSVREIPLKNGYNQFMKRVFDVITSLTALLIASPFFMLLAILIKIDSPGPIFFMQDRVGLDRKLFKLYKFRTMRVQTRESSDTTWGSKNDMRITRLGNILRKTSIDELPQLFNVFMGQMSIVGPRPERPHFVEQFRTRYASAHYMRRHAVKSGLTGWAQINGYRGDTSIEKRVELDIFYIENWSIWLDIIIILKTVPSMIKTPGE